MLNPIDANKKKAGDEAVKYIRGGMTVGLGSGSTVYWMLKELGEQIKKGLVVKGIPTSRRTEDWAKEFGIPLTEFSIAGEIDLAIDGADEIDEQFNLLKGGGGSLVREKIVDSVAKELIIIADQSKMVSRLGRFSLPVEVLPFGWELTANHISQLNCIPSLRIKDGDVFISDNGNYILDCKFERIIEPAGLHEKLKLLVGVVETGLFVDMVDRVVVGCDDGVRNYVNG